MPRGINPGKTDVAVQNHLRKQGFAGYIRIDSHTGDDGRAVTLVRRSRQAVPWTADLLSWLLQAAATLPGATTPAVRNEGQGLEVVWDGVR